MDLDEVDDEFLPHPDDGEFITRGEYRRMSALVVRRLQRIEGLCFEDEKDEQGTVVRPSLDTFIKTGTRHIQTLCDYARAAKRVGALLTAGGATIAAVDQVLRVLGLL